MLPFIFPPEMLKQIPAEWHIAKRFVAKAISRIIEKQPVAAVYAPNDFGKPLPVTILSADDQNGIVMQPLKKESLVSFIDSNRLVVLVDDNGKNQFVISQIMLKDGNLVAPIPNEMIKIQRRDGFRVAAPADEDFKLVLNLGAGQELETKVMNISMKGILLDMRQGVIAPEVGRVWYGAYFERLKSKSNTFTLVVKNIVPGAQLDRIRCGCILENPSKQTVHDFETTRNEIESARTGGTLNRWFHDVSWIE